MYNEQEDLRFEFGKNWQSFLKKKFSDDVLNESKDHLLKDLGKKNLKGLRVLDVGSGSGIHSLAAIQADADEVISFDFDKSSVDATKSVHKASGSPENWQVFQGSVLDVEFMETLGTFDLVYAWGVLHHTGEVWDALDQAINRVNNTGSLYIGLYDSDCSAKNPEYWFNIKQQYNLSGKVKKHYFELWYILGFFLKYNPLNINKLCRYITSYKKKRGMDFIHDVKDWLGGWPMEYCRIYDVIPFVQQRNMHLINIKTGELVSEYVFTRQASLEYKEQYIVPYNVLWNVPLIRNVSDFNRLKKFDNIYIYGSGGGGHNIKSALERSTLRSPSGFISTSGGEDVLGLKVFSFDEVREIIGGNDIIVLASMYYGEISCLLAMREITFFYNAYPYILSTK